ncbi:SAM domain-containing protein SAMSN-1b isoform X2 [Engraulis encrasicolus]|uniref:SAM domain-containing protein SAMSN-1b isoform X2 n=1 Tax=Engraulis encrasicolus TaxID=184585 RepID=UPI002FCE87BE
MDHKNERSSSFGKFDQFRNHVRQAKSEEAGDSEPCAEAEESPECEDSKQQQQQQQHGAISRKMKAISMTMRKRMGKKYIKALSEETGEDGAEAQEKEAADTDSSSSLAKTCRHSGNSLESLYSHNSGQSSSSGVTSGSEGSSNRDSLRLEEEPAAYTGAFCGRARVHTDFVPSPYDTESLRLKVGDMIDVISKPPMGIWTGMLGGRVGTFKFIYVELVVEKEPEPRRRAPNAARSKRPRPNTLLELLACLNLEEHASSLMLNGYQTVEDLKELREQHLIELNMSDPEHRHRLLAATECLHEPEHVTKDGEETPPMSPSEDLKAELKDCPRDSGCYIPSDASDSGGKDVNFLDDSGTSKDDSVNLLALESSPAEA